MKASSNYVPPADREIAVAAIVAVCVAAGESAEEATAGRRFSRCAAVRACAHAALVDLGWSPRRAGKAVHHNHRVCTHAPNLDLVVVAKRAAMAAMEPRRREVEAVVAALREIVECFAEECRRRRGGMTTLAEKRRALIEQAEGLGCRPTELARLIGVRRESISRWLTGRHRDRRKPPIAPVLDPPIICGSRFLASRGGFEVEVRSVLTMQVEVVDNRGRHRRISKHLLRTRYTPIASAAGRAAC